jgi:hypothetical protein
VFHLAGKSPTASCEKSSSTSIFSPGTKSYLEYVASPVAFTSAGDAFSPLLLVAADSPVSFLFSFAFASSAGLVSSFFLPASSIGFVAALEAFSEIFSAILSSVFCFVRFAIFFRICASAWSTKTNSRAKRSVYFIPAVFK